MNSNQWQKRISRRSDFTCGLVHLTKPQEENSLSSMDVLIKILKEKTLVASEKGYICGKQKVVCFQDVPLQSLSENIFYEQQLRHEDKTQETRYCPFGLRFSKSLIYKLGGRPVFYEDTEIAKSILPEEEYWRIVRFDLSNPDNFIDWTHEREWRIKGNVKFEWSDVEVLLSQDYSIHKFIKACEKNNMGNIINEIKGVTTLRSIIF